MKKSELFQIGNFLATFLGFCQENNGQSNIFLTCRFVKEQIINM